MATLSLPPGTCPRSSAATDPATVARAWFMGKWPLLFNPIAPVPLAIGIRRDLLKARGESVSDSGVRRALKSWCNQPMYLERIACGGYRYGPTGPAGKVTDKQRKRATRTLRGRAEPESTNT